MTTTVELTEVDFAIHLAQNGRAILERFEDTVGSFTVTNWNDDNVNGLLDSAENNIGANPFLLPNQTRLNDPDLMKLVIKKPTQVGADTTVTITYSGRDVRLWKKMNKDNMRYDDPAAKKAVFDLTTMPTELWVEIGDVSQSIGDAKINIEYQGVFDKVAATGIWAAQSRFATSGTILTEADNPLYIHQFDVHSGSLGLNTMAKAQTTRMSAADKARFADTWATANMLEIGFTVSPPGVSKYRMNLTFDITRSADVMHRTNSDAPLSLKQFPAWRDNSNDETSCNHDNDTDMYIRSTRTLIDNIYSMDSPGLALQPRILQRSYRQVYGNFMEFVRVVIGDPQIQRPPAGSHAPFPAQGSRALHYTHWHSRLYVKPVPDPLNNENKIYERKDDVTIGPDGLVANGIGSGHVPNTAFHAPV